MQNYAHLLPALSLLSLATTAPSAIAQPPGGSAPASGGSGKASNHQTLYLENADRFIRKDAAKFTPSTDEVQAPPEPQPLQGPKEPTARQLEAQATLELAMALQSRNDSAAIAAFDKASKLGEGYADYMLARIYRYGELGAQKDMKIALAHYQRGAERKDQPSQSDLADIYLEGIEGVPKNPAKAAVYLRGVVNNGKGCPGTRGVCTLKLANLCAKGDGVPKDKDLAIKYFEKVDGMDPPAEDAATFGLIYRAKGEERRKAELSARFEAGTEKDPAQAQALLEEAGREAEAAAGYYGKAVKQLARATDDPAALYALSRLYAEGRGAEKDASQAQSLLEQAGQKGSAAAKYDLENPTSSPALKSADAAQTETIRVAAEAGSPRAKVAMAAILLGSEPKDPERALSLLRQASAEGNADADVALARLQATSNPQRAMSLLESAMAKGQTDAPFEIARLLQSGALGKPDAPRILSLYKQAADAGNAGAHFALAKIYSSARLAPPDAKLAATHYIKAGELGSNEAQLAVLRFYFDDRAPAMAREGGTFSPSIRAEIRSQAAKDTVFSFATDAAKSGSQETRFYLAKCHDDGIGTEKDAVTAAELYRKAAGVVDLGALVPKFRDALKSGEAATIKDFVDQNPEIAAATFVDDGLKKNALLVAVQEMPPGDQRLEVLRLLVAKGAKAGFVATAPEGADAAVADKTCNAVGYPENLTIAELDFLLGKGANPDFGIGAAKETPLLKLCKMYVQPAEPEAGQKLSQQDVLDRIKVFMKHGASTRNQAAAPAELVVNGTTIKASSAAQLAKDAGSAELKTALRLN